LTNVAVSTEELLLWLSALWGHGTWRVGPVSSDCITVFVFRLEGTLKMEAVCFFEALDPSAGPQGIIIRKAAGERRTLNRHFAIICAVRFD